MRWDDLFADLDAQAAALEVAARAGEIDERTRIEVGELGLADRLRSALGAPLQLRLTGGHAVAGELARVGPDWLLLDQPGGREVVVALAALVTVGGLGRRAEAPGSVGAVSMRLNIRHVLRGLARDRSPVQLHLVDGSVLAATIDRIGADLIDVALHAAGELRRRSEVRSSAAVPFTALAAVRREV